MDMTYWGTRFRALFRVQVIQAIVQKVFRQPSQDTEMVEGSDVGDYQDAALSIRKNSESGEIQAHRRSTDNIDAEDKSSLIVKKVIDGEEGHDTGKNNKVEKFQQRPQDSEKVEGSDVADHHNAAPIHFVPESSERAHHSRTNFDVEQVDRSKPYPESEAEAQRDIHGILPTIRGGQPGIDQHPAEHPLSLKRPRGGKKRGSPTAGLETNKRPRCRNFTGHESDRVVILRLEANLVKGKRNEPLWESIAEKMPGRTAKQCQNRFDTVSKSYKPFIDSQNKQFSQITVEDYQKMKAEKYKSSEARTSSIEIEPTGAEHEFSGVELSGVRFPLNLFQWMMVLAVDLIFSLGIVAG
ncbi:hypothetical protein M758_5G056300 [Ceratodon purpureus]|nr:hypothetical protein M758_5G056300 [Ceratodon purpureus]